jgi:phage tail sheath protein FI
MATYMTPGVYVEEIPARNKPIEGVSTSVAAFIGLAPGGPLNRPEKITDWSQFERIYGDPDHPKRGPYMEGAYLAHAVRGFFANQGTECWVVRVGGTGQPRVALLDEKHKTAVLEATALPEVDEEVRLELTLDPPRTLPPGKGAQNGAGAKRAGAEQADAEAGGAGAGAGQADAEAGGAGAGAKQERKLPPPTYTLVVTAGTTHEKFEHVEASALAATVNEGDDKSEPAIPKSGLITLGRLPVDEGLRPAADTYRLSARPKLVAEVEASEIEGSPADRSGLGGLSAIEDISIVCVPDLVSVAKTDVELRDLQGKVIAHCEDMADRVAVLDIPPDLKPTEALAWRVNDARYDYKQATLYYPWLEVMDPLSKFPKLVPPCGHVAGVWARTDKTRGVHKAPANEAVMAITGLGFQVTEVEQGELNRAGLNCIRSFPGRGIKVWGARTLSYDPEWRYLNVRRLFNYISDSIMRGTQWAVFEPNDERLWIQLQIAVSNFLTIAWRNGALFGATPDQAFYVKCNSETNPPELIELGQVVTEIGIAPVKPAEFVVFRISQYTAGEGAA